MTILQDRETPLLKASRKGHTEIVSQLIKAGGDPNAANKVICRIKLLTTNIYGHMHVHLSSFCLIAI